MARVGLRELPVKVSSTIEAMSAHERLARVAIQTETTNHLVQHGPAIIEKCLLERGIVLSKWYTPTFFFRQSQRSGVARMTGRPARKIDGSFCPDLDLNYIFLQTDLIKIVQAFFHEQVHSLGQAKIIRYGDRLTDIIGYRTLVIFPNDHFVTGEYLEESVVDVLAAEMSAQYLKLHGESLLPREIAFLAGGPMYQKLRASFFMIADVSPQIESLLFRARFDRSLIGTLCRTINNEFGPGSSQRLFALTAEDVWGIHSLVHEMAAVYETETR